MNCTGCNRDIDAIGQDNMSHVPGRPLCEDCAGAPGADGCPDDCSLCGAYCVYD